MEMSGAARGFLEQKRRPKESASWLELFAGEVKFTSAGGGRSGTAEGAGIVCESVARGVYAGGGSLGTVLSSDGGEQGCLLSAENGRPLSLETDFGNEGYAS